MRKRNRIAALACAAALCSLMATPAFAAVAPNGDPTTDGDVTSQNYSGTLKGDESFDAPLNIKADIAKPGEKIVKVTVPSVMPVAIETGLGGSGGSTTVFAKAVASTAKIQNSSESSSAVSVSLVSVTDAAVDGHKLLDQVSMTLAGDSSATLNSFKADTPVPLFASIAAGGEGTVTASAAALTEDTEIFPGSYTVATTLKVALV